MIYLFFDWCLKKTDNISNALRVFQHRKTRTFKIDGHGSDWHLQAQDRHIVKWTHASLKVFRFEIATGILFREINVFLSFFRGNLAIFTGVQWYYLYSQFHEFSVKLMIFLQHFTDSFLNGQLLIFPWIQWSFICMHSHFEDFLPIQNPWK